jgi:DNA polymerase-1
MNRNTLLLDGDLIAYRIAAALETPVNWGDGLWTLHCYEDECNKAFVHKVESIKAETGLTEVVVAISSRTNYRKDINPLYKANRKATRRPLCLAPLLDFVKEDYNHVILDNIEADDVMGILATQDPDRYLIVSDDKDMLTIPNARIWKDSEVVHITPEEAYEHFITQALKGDPTDGYYGVKGVGEVTARRLIDKHRGTPWSLWEGVLKADGGDEEEALLNARMARILTEDLWDGDKPILWLPPINEEEVSNA